MADLLCDSEDFTITVAAVDVVDFEMTVNYPTDVPEGDEVTVTVDIENTCAIEIEVCGHLYDMDAEVVADREPNLCGCISEEAWAIGPWKNIAVGATETLSFSTDWLPFVAMPDHDLHCKMTVCGRPATAVAC